MSDTTDEKTLAQYKTAMEEWERQHPITPDQAACQMLCGGGHDGWHSFACPIANKARRATQ